MIGTIATSVGSFAVNTAKEYAFTKILDVIWKKITPGNDVEKAVNNAFDKSLKEVFPNKDYRTVITDDFKRDLEEMIISPNTWQSTADSEHNQVYTLFMQYLSESSPFAFSYIVELKAEARYNNMLQLLQTAICGQNVSVELIENLTSQGVAPLLDELKVKSALRIINEIENSSYDLLEHTPNVYSKLLLYKGRCLQFISLKDACDCYDKAYELNPGNKEITEAKVISLLAKGEIKDIRTISHKLSVDNRFRILVDIVISDNIQEAYLNAPEALRSDLGFRYLVAEKMINKIDSIDFLFDDSVDYTLSLPSNLAYSNLSIWSFIMGYYRTQDAQKGVKFYRELYSDLDTKSVIVAEQFINHLEKTEIKETFQVVYLLYYYWKYLLEGGKKWIDLYQQTIQEKQTKEGYVFSLLEANMLQMEDRFEEAFTVASAIVYDDPAAVCCFMCVMSMKSTSMEYVKWILEDFTSRTIKINDTCSRFLAQVLNNNVSPDIKILVQDAIFEHEIAKDIILLLLGTGNDDVLSHIKNQTTEIPDELIPFAAIALSKNDEKEYAFDILNARVDNGINDFRRYTFLKILSENPLHYRELYKILKDNRAAREINDFALLTKEYELANKLLDYDNAFQVISILYEQYPDNETIFVNYVVSSQHVKSPLLEELKDKVSKFTYSNDTSIRLIYQAYASAGSIDFAIEFLYQQTLSRNTEFLRNFYQIEATQGFVKQISHIECDVISDGCCVDFIKNGEKVREIVTHDNEFSSLLGFKKGSEFSIKQNDGFDTYQIENVWNKYFALSSEIFKEIMFSGGNSVFRPIQIDMEHPWESLEKELEKIDPDAKNRHQRYIDSVAAYEKGSMGLCQLVRENDLLGDYYSKLFGSFKIYVPSCTQQLIHIRGVNLDDNRFVLEITSLLTLFEYSTKYNITFNLEQKFLIAKSVRELVVNNINQYGSFWYTNIYNIYENKSIKRYANDPIEDAKQRLHNLLSWIDTYCEVVIVDASLSIDDGNQPLSSRIMLDSLCLLMNGNAILITEDVFLGTLPQLHLPIMTVEAYIQISTNSIERIKLSRFLAESRYIGVTIDKDFVIEQYRKYQEKEPNVYQNILETMSVNPFMFSVAVNASLELAQTPIITTQIIVTITNMLAMAMKPLPQDFFDRSWNETEAYLDIMPTPATKLLKECLKSARKIVGM